MLLSGLICSIVGWSLILIFGIHGVPYDTGAYKIRFAYRTAPSRAAFLGTLGVTLGILGFVFQLIAFIW